MRKLLFIYFFILPFICIAQTGLYTYDGGYFIRKGNAWTEYRPSLKADAWAYYEQYNEEEGFFNIRSSACAISVPKNTNNNFFIMENGVWKTIYYTKEIYTYFDDNSRHIYCYKGGYFVRDGNQWREYRWDVVGKVWAYYDQYNEEEGFFNIKSSACAISVPKSVNNNFFIMKDGKWEFIYKTTSIYDSSLKQPNVQSGNSNGQNYVPYIQQQNIEMPCVGCGGTKKCSICNGKGYTTSASSRRIYHECGACGGTGICQSCRFR